MDRSDRERRKRKKKGKGNNYEKRQTPPDSSSHRSPPKPQSPSQSINPPTRCSAAAAAASPSAMLARKAPAICRTSGRASLSAPTAASVAGAALWCRCRCWHVHRVRVSECGWIGVSVSMNGTDWLWCRCHHVHRVRVRLSVGRGFDYHNHGTTDQSGARRRARPALCAQALARPERATTSEALDAKD